MSKQGIVYFVGAGPGDPKLITMRGLECLQEADCIVYDRLANPELIKHAKVDVETIFCGKLPDHHTLTQDEINAVLIEKAKEGKNVVRLKGGDPAVFGRVGEEADFCKKHGIPYEMIPGITAGIAAPLYAGIPITHREHSTSFACITGHALGTDMTDTRWQGLADSIDSLVFYMGIKNLPIIATKLVEHGKAPETPTAVIEWGTTEKQRVAVGTLGTIVQVMEEQQLKNPAIIIVGDVVGLREQLKWWENDL
ncbi:uroporphyrinogen-III C-methyltransferase [Halalkalibacter urbisdiaboli]|uniref:uroporphyrinogen-III C-methyltransferase n=1 Tax=Halalkalibacter urbisdiaboli TaxID=1960589 RepID=UPI000B448754|nr:uroporphyrinogen-III C-methyltransferase [Halalkalibacter urbisdiaboli]